MNRFYRMQVFGAALIAASIVPAMKAQDDNKAPKAAETDEEVLVLTPFEVNTKNDRGWYASNSISAARTNVEISKLPMNMSVLTNEFLSDLGVTDATEAVARYTPGVTVGAYNNLVIRGLDNGGFSYRDGLRNANIRWSPGIDRIEILRGPAAVLYGQTGPGGIVNYVTKKPTFHNNFFVKGTMGDFGYYRGDADINLAAPGDLRKVIGARINLGYEKSDGWQDRDSQKRDSYDAILSFRPFNGRVSLDVSKNHSLMDIAIVTGPQISNRDTGYSGAAIDHSVSGSPSNKAVQGYVMSEIPRNWNFSGKGSGLIENVDNSVIDGSVRITDQLTLRSVYNKNDRKAKVSLLLVNQDLAYSRNSDGTPALSADGVHPMLNIGAPVLVQAPVIRHNEAYQQSLLWTPTFAGTKHRILAGYDTQKTEDNQYSLMSVPNANPSYGFTFPFTSWPGMNDVFKNYNGQTLPWDTDAAGSPIKDVHPMSAKEALANGNWWMIFSQTTLTKSKAYYVTDVISAFQDKLNILVGVRHSTFETSNLDPITLVPRTISNSGGLTVAKVSKNSPQIGVSYAVTSSVNLYASYSESVSPVTDANPDGAVFKPKIAKGSEAGLKFNAFNNLLQGTVAGFDITYWGNIMRDPRDTGVSGNPFMNYRIQVNGRQTTGGEADLLFQSKDMAWQVFAGLTLYNGKIKDPSELAGKVAAMQGNWNTTTQVYSRVPVANQSMVMGYLGKPEFFVKNKLSSYVKYTFKNGGLKGLNLRLGYVWTGERSNIGPVSGGVILYRLPGYSLFDTGIGYGRKLGNAWWSLDLSISNLTDTKYINYYNEGGYLYYAYPRDFRLSTSFKF